MALFKFLSRAGITVIIIEVGVVVEPALVSPEGFGISEDNLFFIFLVLDELFTLGFGQFGEVDSFLAVVERSDGPFFGLVVVLGLLDDKFDLIIG